MKLTLDTSVAHSRGVFDDKRGEARIWYVQWPLLPRPDHGHVPAHVFHCSLYSRVLDAASGLNT